MSTLSQRRRQSAAPSPGRRAAIYLRISRDPENDELGVKRQERACRELIAGLGWTLVDVFVDNDTSAYSRKVRPAFAKMRAAVEAGLVDAIVTKRSDRLARPDLRDLEDLIDWINSTEVAVATVSSGSYDVTTADGRQIARLLGVVARGESERTAERIADKMDELRDGGWWRGGTAPYGYRIVRADDGRHATLAINEAEAAVIRWMAEAVLAGRSLVSITRQLAADEVPVPPAVGKRKEATAWHRATVRNILIRPTVAGLVGVPRVRGEAGAPQPTSGQAIHGPGRWEAILEPEVWREVRETLEDPARHRATEPRDFLLSSMIWGRIEGEAAPVKLTSARGAWGRKRRMYTTTRAGGTIDAEATEAFVVAALLRRYDDVAHGTDDDRARAAAQAQVDALDAEVEALAQERARGEISYAEWRVLRDGLAQRMEAARAGLRQARTVEARTAATLAAPGALRKAWPELSFAERRQVLKAAVERIDVTPAAPFARVENFDASRITITWSR